MLALAIGHFGEAVSRQIYQALVIAEIEEVDQLCAPGRLAGPRELPPVNNNIDRTRLARVGSARHGDFYASVLRELPQGIGAFDKTGIREL